MVVGYHHFRKPPNIVVYKSVFKHIIGMYPTRVFIAKEKETVSLVQIPSKLRLLYLSRSWRTGTLL